MTFTPMLKAGLPLEVIYHVVDLASAEDDYQFSTTKACALVSTALVDFCQSLMFSCIKVNGGKIDRRDQSERTLHISSTSFVNALQTAAGGYLGNAVRKLTFIVTQVDFDNATALQHALKKITRLESLNIAYDSSVPFSTRHSTLMHTLFQPLIELPSLWNLHVADISFAAIGPGLRRMHIFASLPCLFVKSPDLAQSFAFHHPRLQSITFNNNVAPVLKELLLSQGQDESPAIDLGDLQTISLCYLDKGSLEACQLLAERASGLEELRFLAEEIDPGFALYGSCRIYNAIVPSLKTLKILHLDLPFARYQCRLSGFFSDFATELEAITRVENRIEKIIFSIATRFSNPCLASGYWVVPTTLDRIFSDEAGWPYVKLVTIRFTGLREEGRLPLDAELLKMRLPRLMSSQRFKFDLEVLDQICESCECGGTNWFCRGESGHMGT